MNVLQRDMAGLPLWAWALIVGGGGLLLAVVIRRQSGGGGGGLGQNAAGQSAMAQVPSQIDPYTGVPYSIEGATNPATGLPAYYGGPGVDQNPGPTPGPTPQSGGQPGQCPPFHHWDAASATCVHDPDANPTPGPTGGGTGGNGGGGSGGGPGGGTGPRYQIVNARSWPEPDSSLSSIWQDHAHGIPWQQWESEVVRINGIQNPNLIYPGQAIRIPV